MGSLRDVAFVLNTPGAGVWSLRGSLAQGVWPPLASTKSGCVSVRELTSRFARSGKDLRDMAAASGDVWSDIDRRTLVDELRVRVRDPAIIDQSPTDFCGPLAVVFELARRDPARYIRGADHLLRTGSLPTFDGEPIPTEPELRDNGLPALSESSDWEIGEVDWLYAATMRDDENVFQDIDDGQGVEAASQSGAMLTWTRKILGLSAERHVCHFSGELEALRMAQSTVETGGVAFLAIDARVIKDGAASGDDEEDVHWRRRSHVARKPVGKFPAGTTHGQDDGSSYNHWVSYLGGLKPRHPGERDQMRFRIWSWAAEFEISGLAEDIGEYLYVVVTGRP